MVSVTMHCAAKKANEIAIAPAAKTTRAVAVMASDTFSRSSGSGFVGMVVGELLLLDG
jgi:hypothetical protein